MAALAAMQGLNGAGQASATSRQEPSAVVPPAPVQRQEPAAANTTDPVGPLFPIPEGTVIETVLVTKLEGSTAAPVSVLVTSPVYALDHRTVLVPPGAKIFGKSEAVKAFGESRLAVTFQRLMLPSGTAFRLESFPALSPLGESGLKDQTDNHLASVIGASAAVGVISGLAQFVSSGFGRAGTSVVIGSATEGTGQATSMVMSRYLSRLPTVTIREGHQVIVYTTSDLQLPAYRPRLLTAQK